MKRVLRGAAPIFEQLEPRILLSGSPMPETAESAALNVDLQENVDQSQEITEILFVDSKVDNYGDLIDNLSRNVEIHVIDQNSDGLAQIANYLKDRSGITAGPYNVSRICWRFRYW